MDTSLFLAKLIGPTMLAISAAMLINQDNTRDMATDFLEHRGLIFLAGILTLIGGIAVVLVHNVWVPGWPVIITILGWLSVIGGAFRIIFPDSVKSMGQAMLEKRGLLTSAGIVQGVIGAWLCYVSYMGV
jgi:cytochrome bd-type quinol oxidase subunit 2